MEKSAKVKVTRDPEKPVERNVLAQAIVDIAAAMKKLTYGGVNRDAIVILVHDQTKLPKRDIVAVFNALQDLERQFCR